MKMNPDVLFCGQTFGQRGHQERDADHSHQILNGNERAQDGPDTDGLSLPRVDQLTQENTSHQQENTETVKMIHTLTHSRASLERSGPTDRSERRRRS